MNRSVYRSAACLLLLFYTIYSYASPHSSSFIVAPPSTKGFKLKKTTQKQLEGKVEEMLRRAGASKGPVSVFAICPRVEFLEGKKVRGMSRQYIAEIVFRLELKNLLTGEIFHSLEKKLKSIGSKKEEAIHGAIHAINPSHDRYIKLIKEAQQKVHQYHNMHCRELLAAGDVAREADDFEKAITLYQSIPKKTSCYAQAYEHLKTVYLGFQEENCEQLLKETNAAIKDEAYQEALTYIRLIDTESTCCVDAENSLSDLFAKVTEVRHSKQINFLQNRINNKAILQEARQQAMQAIAKQYCRQLARVWAEKRRR